MSTEERPQNGSPSEVSRRSDLKSGAADALDVHGGYVLLLGGVALIALACVFAKRAAVAPIFAISGVSLIILGAFYSRIEGNVQATKDGVKAAVRAAQRKSEEFDLPPSLVPEVIERTLDGLEITSRRNENIQRGEQAASEAVQSVSRGPRAKASQVIDHFASWLGGSDGGAFPVVRTRVRTPDGEFDVLADDSDEILVAEAKAVNRPIDAGIVRQLALRVPPADLHHRKIRRALVVPTGSEMTRGAFSAAETHGIEIYEVGDDGGVRPLE